MVISIHKWCKAAYFYYLSEEGLLYHLYDPTLFLHRGVTPVRTTNLRDPRFLRFFTRRLQMTPVAALPHVAARFPYVSVCGAEANFLALHEGCFHAPCVFTGFERAMGDDGIWEGAPQHEAVAASDGVASSFRFKTSCRRSDGDTHGEGSGGRASDGVASSFRFKTSCRRSDGDRHGEGSGGRALGRTAPPTALLLPGDLRIPFAAGALREHEGRLFHPLSVSLLPRILTEAQPPLHPQSSPALSRQEVMARTNTTEALADLTSSSSALQKKQTQDSEGASFASGTLYAAECCDVSALEEWLLRATGYKHGRCDAPYSSSSFLASAGEALLPPPVTTMCRFGLLSSALALELGLHCIDEDDGQEVGHAADGGHVKGGASGSAGAPARLRYSIQFDRGGVTPIRRLLD
jgi:hypothetical protein